MLVGADAHHVLKRADENLAIADSTGAGLARDGVDDFLDLIVAHHHLDFHFGHEVGDVLGAAIELGVTLLASDASHLVHRQAQHAHPLKLALHHIKSEGLDHRLDLLHQRYTFRARRCLSSLQRASSVLSQMSRESSQKRPFMRGRWAFAAFESRVVRMLKDFPFGALRPARLVVCYLELSPLMKTIAP